MRRRITLDQFVAECSAQFAPAGKPSSGQALQKFVGCDDSGDAEWATTDVRELPRDLALRSSEIVSSDVSSDVLLVDTKVWLSTADGGSAGHDESVALPREYPSELATTVPVIAETSSLILDRLGPSAHGGSLDLVTTGELQRIDLTQTDRGHVVALCRHYSDLALDSVDTSLITVAERLQLDAVATYDHRDLRVVRPRQIDAFEVLP